MFRTPSSSQHSQLLSEWRWKRDEVAAGAGELNAGKPSLRRADQQQQLSVSFPHIIIGQSSDGASIGNIVGSRQLLFKYFLLLFSEIFFSFKWEDHEVMDEEDTSVTLI